jgi:hypothetical protein
LKGTQKNLVSLKFEAIDDCPFNIHKLRKCKEQKDENSLKYIQKKTSEKGKPGENRGRKANGSNVTKVTKIARPPMIIDL